ncbi:MAG: actin-binding WH2 domain-containing protein [Chloroflexi bacterium]|nr:actin-binding WH2 domain-containing protein [Chloroflexota bacterium]
MLTELDLLLRNRFRFFAEVRDGVGVPRKIRAMLLYSSIFLALFGAVIGSEHSVWQALSSGVKLPILFLVALLVCLPTLYFFNTIFEAPLTVSQNFALLLSAITLTSVVLLAFVPVTLFFLITTSQYQFFKLLNVGIFVISGAIGIRQLMQGMTMLTAEQRRGARARANILRLWILLYAFVGSQLAWTLRPFFGAPGLPFELFRGLGGNFYTNIFASLGEILGFFTVR